MEHPRAARWLLLLHRPPHLDSVFISPALAEYTSIHALLEAWPTGAAWRLRDRFIFWLSWHIVSVIWARDTDNAVKYQWVRLHHIFETAQS